MKNKYKKCSKCGEKFYGSHRVGKLYLSGKDAQAVGAYLQNKLWCAKCMPEIKEN